MDIHSKTLLPSVMHDKDGKEKETSIIRVDEHGTVKSVLKRVWLSENEGHMYKAKNDKWTITGEGYRHLNRYANLFEIKKEKIIINNEQISNPYILFDAKGKKSKMIETVAVGGRSPSGEFHITEATIIMDVNEAFVKAILYKVKDDSTAGKIVPTCMLDGEKGAIYAIDENVSVVLDLSNKKAFDLYIKQLSDIEFADRKVHTLAWRNAIKAHPAIGKSILVPTQKGNDKVAYVDIVMWVDNFTPEELEIIRKYKEDGKIDPSVIGDLTDCDPTDRDPDEEYEILEDDEPQKVNPDAHINAERESILDYILESEGVIGPAKLDEIVSKYVNLEEKKLHEATILILKAVKTDINNYTAENMEG